MNKILLAVLGIIFIILLIFLLRSCEEDTNEKFEAVLPEYRKGEMIVVYKDAPTPAAKQKVRDEIGEQIDLSGVTIRQCSACDDYVELWQADSIETFIHGEIASSGTGKTKPVGEDTLAMCSLNMLSTLPVDYTPIDERYIESKENMRRLYTPFINPAGKDTIVIAVIDTGIDTVNFNNQPYLWTNNTDTSCYSGFSHGWNFVNNSSNVFDDNLTKHGTIVSHFIINEFQNAPDNFIQIMSLKTHDDQGTGDLFSSICAINYAIRKGANIINASWGFYNYDSITIPYLDHLITQELQEKGILFIAAAGNKLDKADSLIKIVYKDKNGVELPDGSLRNINVNQFYPAVLSNDANNNVITVTTSFNDQISPTQNFSDSYVDMGVKADTATASGMSFKLPFPANDDYLSGSSFATAIFSGKIGAFLPRGEYEAGINKKDAIQKLSTIHTVHGIPPIISGEAGLENKKLIREGKFSYANK